MSKPKPTYTTCAKDGGANQSKTTMPPPSDTYRDNFDDIFRKKPTSLVLTPSSKPVIIEP